MEAYPWGHNRRFNSYTEYIKKRFGERVQKLALDAGFTCPNRNGTRGRGGCTYCNNNAFNPSYCRGGLSIPEQLQKGVDFYRTRYPRVRKYLAYFQAYTNTYGSLRELTGLYREAIEFPGVVGLVIGTRPDCVPDELLDYFRQLSEQVYVVIEYGIETCRNRTLAMINRGHTFEDSVDALERTARRGIRRGGHFILGLPGEDPGDILACIRRISELPLNNIKFHQLQIVEGTAMGRDYKGNPGLIGTYGLGDYLNLMVEVVENLNPGFVLERISGEVNPEYLLSPSWEIRYDMVLKRFERLLEERGTWQGKKYGH